MSKCILVVDDSPQVSGFLADDLLKLEGFRTITAADGQSAIHSALEYRPDLIIADYLMPQGTGLDVLIKLRQLDFHIPFILMTAEGSEELAAQALRLGVRDYLIKPIDADDLLHAVHRIFNGNAHSTLRAPQMEPQAHRQETPETSDFVFDLLAQAQDGLMLVDGQGQVVFCNVIAAQILASRPAAELMGHTFDQAIMNQDIVDLVANQQQVSQTTHSEIILEDNQLVYSAVLTSMPAAGHLLVLRDITYLKELDRVKSDFIERVSQDIRSPLTTILSYAELLLGTGEFNERQTKFIQRIIFSVQSITALLSDLMELNRIEAGGGADFEPVQLGLILRYAIEGAYHKLEQKQLQVVVDVADGLSPVMGNPLRLRQMLQHLLENAIIYTPVDGEICLWLREETGFLLLSVQDSGIGIPLADQPHIFDDFYRAKNVQGKQRGNTGLGLTIAKGIIEAHGGRIWAESPGEGQGTTFTVMLPVHHG